MKLLAYSRGDNTNNNLLRTELMTSFSPVSSPFRNHRTAGLTNAQSESDIWVIVLRCRLFGRRTQGSHMAEEGKIYEWGEYK